MAAIILHLSDIHIEDESDYVIGRWREISGAVYEHLPSATAVFILVSGDIAQSGKAAEYAIAERFLKSIQADIREEKDIPVEFVISPGNHDCDFSGDQSVRNSVLKDIPSHEHNMPPGLVDAASKVQAAFRAFRARMVSADSLIHDDFLWSVQAFSVEGRNIWFDTLNVSWMSSRHEQQGGILFPFSPYREFGPADCDLRIGVMHHPLNWFQQGNYQKFRSFVQGLEDLIFSGHEHEGNVSVRTEARGGECAYVEGCALQTKFSGTSAFNLAVLDVAGQRFSCEKFTFDSDRYFSSGADAWLPLRALPRRADSEFQLVSTFSERLRDPGATLRHPDKTHLTLDDFYVFPDLDKPRAGGGKARVAKLANRKNSNTLTLLPSLESHILIEGEENAGKTRLLYQLFSSYHSQGYLPLYIDARRVKSARDTDIAKLVNSAVTEQYGTKNVPLFLQAKASRKILLVDDFDLCPLNSAAREQFHTYFQTGFDWRIITVGTNFEVSETVSSSKLTFLGSYVHFRMLPLGYERRGELVRKWNSLGSTEVTTTNQWLQSCDQAERLIDSARLQHVATTVPIMVLSLLQANSSGVPRDMHSSSFAHYFHYLIVGALKHAGVEANDFGRFLAFGTHLSWFVKNHGSDLEISEGQFGAFCDAYSKNWTKTDASSMLEKLVESRILDKHGDVLCFAYQYTYFYFLGKYASTFSSTDEVKAYIAYCVANLYVRECSNALLFLAHHSQDDVVLDQIVAALESHFPDRKPATFTKDDVRIVASLISGAPSLAYEPKDPVVRRQEVHQMQDQMDNGDDGLADAPSPASKGKNLIEELVSLGKTMEVAGILLTNQYASMSREKKNSAISKIFDGSLRVISDFFTVVKNDPERLVQEISSRIQNRSRDLLNSEADIQARHAVAWIIRLVSTSWIMKAGLHVSSQHLADNVNDVVALNPTMAMRLIQVAQSLDSPGRLPQGAIKALMREEHDNPCVMGCLQLLVLNRLYMYDTHHEDKHWAISTFDLAGSKERMQVAERKRRLSARPLPNSSLPRK